MGEDRFQSSEQLQHELEQLEGRDLHLWSIALLVCIVLAAGLCALIAPKLMWNVGQLRLDAAYLPQIFFGFITLIVLFNAYVLEQRRMLRRARREITHQLLRANTAEQLAQVDPLTETYNRRFLHDLLRKEISRAQRTHNNLSLAMIDVNDFKSINTKFGHVIGDGLLRDVATILKSTFRAADSVIRYGGDEFLVIMTETDTEQAAIAIARLQKNVERWNAGKHVADWTLKLSCGFETYQDGMQVEDLITAADQKMYVEKDAGVAVE